MPYSNRYVKTWRGHKIWRNWVINERRLCIITFFKLGFIHNELEKDKKIKSVITLLPGLCQNIDFFVNQNMNAFPFFLYWSIAKIIQDSYVAIIIQHIFLKNVTVTFRAIFHYINVLRFACSGSLVIGRNELI